MNDQKQARHGRQVTHSAEEWRLLLLPGIMDVMRGNARRGNLSRLIQPAMERLVAEVDDALDATPPSVMDKEGAAPSGSKHDYLSLSIYLWPNPDTPDGLPYVVRDGEINPESEKYDRAGLTHMQNTVGLMGLAYTFTGEERYAAKAADFLRVWFLNPATRMNPNMACAQWIPGNGNFKTAFPPRFVPGAAGGGIYVSFGGVIEGNGLPAMLDTVTLLRGSDAWTDNDHAALQAWFSEFLDWLQHSQQGQDEASCPNNHGSWYVVQAATYAWFCGREELGRALLSTNARERIACQIEPDGSMPHELQRAVSNKYVTFTLMSFANLGLLGERLGVDVWDHITDDRRCIQFAVNWLVPYLEGKAKWEWRTIGEPDWTGIVPVLCAACEAYRQPEYAMLIDHIKGYPADHLYRLVYPGFAV